MKPARSSIPLINRTNKSRFISKGLIKLLIVLLILTGVGFVRHSASAWQPSVDTTVNAQKERPSVQGDQAIEQLKQQGAYNSLQEAIGATRYEATQQPSPKIAGLGPAYEFKNSANNLLAYITADGIDLTSLGEMNKDWRLGLKLTGYGYGADLKSVISGQTTATGNRVSIQKSAIDNRQSTIEEWFVNSSRGIEHGFTIATAPSGGKAREPLRLNLAVSGDLQLSINGTSDGSAFHSASDDVLLSYNKLFATDAKGRALAASMKLAGRDLIIEVDDVGAGYPLTIDPLFNQQQKLTAGDGATNDALGTSVAISEDTVVVGAFLDDVGANAHQGSAYVFVRSGATWIQQAKITASDGAASDEFGFSVAISGETVVVGSLEDDVGGNVGQGSAYVFVRSGATWTQQAQLTASGGAAGDGFGFSVATSGDTVVVGAWNSNVGGNVGQGSAYVFVRSGATWIQQAQLTASDGAATDEFGDSVAISGDTVVVGAFADDVGGNAFQGSAYVFVRSGATWIQQAQLTASDGAAFDEFGDSVAISGDTVVVGAFLDDVGPNAAQGSAYVFVRSGTIWAQQVKLTALDGAASDIFGQSVAINGNTLVVGAEADDVGANMNQGSTYVFVRSGTAWTQQVKLTASDGAAGDNFGKSVALSGDTVVVGASHDDVGANADQGSTYVFVCEYNEQSHLLASDGATNDQFGFSVAVSGDTVVVGAYADDGGANTNQGSAYVFARIGTSWTELQKLTASDGAANDLFGNSVSISGDTLVIGAPFHKVGGNLDQGVAYVFTRTGTIWTQQAQLTAADGAASDQFGVSVAINGDTVVIGASHDTLGANSLQGSAYVFIRNGTIWTQQQKLTAVDGAAMDLFGISVAISGDTALVGAYFDDIQANPDQGSAYVFTRSGTIWAQQQKLTASDGAAGDLFGFSVAISGDAVVLGAESHNVGANSDQGAAYIFTRSGTVWTQQTQLTASDGAANDFFGYSVAISSDTVVIGAIGDNVAGNPSQGSAYVFARTAASWSQQQKLTASDGALVDEFGQSVTVSGDTIVVGSFFDDVGANVNQGSAYVFFKGCNTSPVIAARSVARQQGSPSASSIIANVDDSQDPIGYLTVSVASAPADISIANLANTNGVITANIAASCYAALGDNIVILQVQDSDGAVSTVQLLVNVSANTLPSLSSYADTSVVVTGSTTVTPNFAPSDNGSIVQFSATSPTFGGTLGATRSSGNITIANARPAGAHIITVTAIDNCGDTISTAFVLTVTCQTITVNPATIPSGTAGTPYSQAFTQTGGNGAVTFTRNGVLPAGMVFTPGIATLQGTPTQVGNFSIVIIATDVNGCSGNRSYTLTINAPTLVWTGATNSDWNTATNWSPNAVPASFHDVLIPSSGVVNEPVVSSSSSVIHAMTVQAGRILTIDSSRQLITQGDIASSGQITGAGLLAFEGATFTQNGAVSVSSVQFDPGSHSLTGGGSFASGIVTVLNGANVTLTSDHSLSVLVINSGGSFNATNRTLTLTGAGTPIFNSGSFTATGGAIVYQGSVSQVVTANIAYNDLTINNAAGVSLAGDTTVDGLLNLATDLMTGSFTLTMPAAGTTSGVGDVVGNVRRTGFSTGGAPLSFGNKLNTIQFNTGGAPTDVTVNLVKSPPAGFSGTVSRTYTITPNGGGGFTATLRLRYLDSEAVGLTESTLELWRYNGASWVSPAGSATRDETSNWVEEGGITAFSPWTIAGPSGPTEVKLISFDATGYDNGVLLEWKTGFEVDNLGFRLYRQDGGSRSLLNSELLAGSALTAGSGTVLTAGRSYAFWASDMEPKRDAPFWLEDIDLNGQSTWHGPFLVKHLGGKPPARSSAESLSQVGQTRADDSSHTVEPFAALGRPNQSMSSPVSLQQTSLASSRALKMGVRRAGWYRITQPELLKAGLDPKTDPRSLRLFVDGIELPIFVTGEDDRRLDANDGVEFYGFGLNTPSTDTRVYWLIDGSQPGLRINKTPEARGYPAGESFEYAVERRDRTIYFSALRNGDEENFFGAVIGANAVEQRLTLSNLAQSASESAVIEVSLQGVTNVAHHVRVSLNGSFLAELSFNGQSKGQAKFEVPHSLLREGENLITLQSINGPSDISLADFIRITYQHSYRAENDRLSFTLNSGQSAAVGGFSTKDIRVFDVTDERNVRELGVMVDQTADGYAATLTAPNAAGLSTGVVAIGSERRLLAVTDCKAFQPSEIMANAPSNLRDASNAADFVIISNGTLLGSLKPLAALRASQGLTTVMVDIEDIYDEFSFGNKSPQSIRDFLSYANMSWKLKPRFVLFAGDASYDARDYLGLGSTDLVPTKLIDTAYLETASDDWFGDFNNDGIADIGLGRLPVRTAEEAAVVVNKLIAYEQSSPSDSVTLVADSGDGFDFEQAATSLRSFIPSSINVTQVFRARTDDTTARDQLLDAINHGQKIVNYSGHGSANVWRGNLLTAADGQYLTNRDRLSLFVMMTCLNGYFQDAVNESLGESLLKAENGGAVAVWASSGLTLPQDQAAMNRELYRLLFSVRNRALTLGELIRQSKAAVRDDDIRRSWILLGDPTMRVK